MEFYVYRTKGCWSCVYLEYIEDTDLDGFVTSSSGYTCNFREVEDFKTFPCNRRLSCYKRSQNELPI